LREQVVNEVVADAGNRQQVYYLQASHIDQATSELEDIVIYDVTDPEARRTTYAERGTMAFNEDQTDLYLNLYDGALYEVPKERQGGFQKAEFKHQFLPIHGISNILERGNDENYRSDREMSTEQLRIAALVYDRREAETREEVKEASLYAVKRALGWRTAGDTLAPLVEDAQAVNQDGAAPSRNRGPRSQPGAFAPDGITRGVAQSTRTSAEREESFRLQAVKYRVEIHKKYAIAFACFVFVLVGAPLAVRFPRGGVGMVITVSVGIFALFWISLIGGETLADRGYVGPATAMWLPNLILLPLGLLLVARMSSMVATARAGGWQDLFFTLRHLLLRPFRRLGSTGGATPS
jgi:lipopolysaccharide export system permease protein